MHPFTILPEYARMLSPDLTHQSRGNDNWLGPEALSRLDFCRIVAKHFGINESIVQGAHHMTATWLNDDPFLICSITLCVLCCVL